jgi:4-hydroxymandelate oxidase
MADELPRTLPDFASRAAELMSEGVYAYFAAGAGDEITLEDNVAAWKRIAIRQRVLIDVSERDLSVEILGKTRPHPFVVAPTAWQTMAHPGGEAELARGVERAKGIYTLSSWAAMPIAEVTDAVPGVDRWLHIHIFRDRDLTDQLIEHGKTRGFEALVVTVDQPVAGRRDRTIRAASFQRPASPNVASPIAGPGNLDASITWRHITELREKSGMPVIVKGVLDPEDAALAVDAGVDGIIVSNHGGRQLDTVLPTAAALPAIAEVVDGRVTLLVDGGIRRGTDALKALALGADGVLIGRPALWGLVVGGAAGVEKVLELMITELDLALAIIGVRRARDLNRSAVLPAPWA